MTRPTRDKDNALIDEAAELPTPSHQGTAGGNLARQVGQRDEDKTATGEDAEATGVEKRDKRDEGDRPSLPERRR